MSLTYGTGRWPFDVSIVQTAALQTSQPSPPPPQGPRGKLGRLRGAQGSGRADINLPHSPHPALAGAATTPSPPQSRKHTKKAPTLPRTWGHPGEEAGVEPGSGRLPPPAANNSRRLHQAVGRSRAAQRPAGPAPPRDARGLSALPAGGGAPEQPGWGWWVFLNAPGTLSERQTVS